MFCNPQCDHWAKLFIPKRTEESSSSPRGRTVTYALELQTNRELQLPGWELAPEQATDILIAIVDGAARVAETHVVEGVVRIDTELREERLMNREVLLHSHIGVEEVRTTSAVPARRTNLIQTRRCEAMERAAWSTAPWRHGTPGDCDSLYSSF